jgi:hypothetical protein
VSKSVPRAHGRPRRADSCSYRPSHVLYMRMACLGWNLTALPMNGVVAVPDRSRVGETPLLQIAARAGSFARGASGLRSHQPVGYSGARWRGGFWLGRGGRRSWWEAERPTLTALRARCWRTALRGNCGGPDKRLLRHEPVVFFHDLQERRRRGRGGGRHVQDRVRRMLASTSAEGFRGHQCVDDRLLGGLHSGLE